MQAGPVVPKILYAHRGASKVVPENTMEAFRRGLQDGATALEMDVHLLADGTVVVFHDDDGERTAKVDALLSNVTYAEVSTWDVGQGFRNDPVVRHFVDRPYRAPKFTDVLAAFPNVFINVDVKTRSRQAVAATIEIIRAHGAEMRVRLNSKKQIVMNYVRELGYAGPKGFGRFEILALLILPRSWLRNLASRGDAVQIPPRYGPFPFDMEWFIRKCHSLGLRIDYWTINDKSNAHRLLAAGADGLMSDDPAEILSVFSRFAP